MGSDQKPEYSSNVVTEPHSIKLLPFFLHGYDTLQFKNITIHTMALSAHKILPTLLFLDTVNRQHTKPCNRNAT